jgi:hypothetical protein
MSSIRYLTLASCALALLLNIQQVDAQEASRDPTVAPAENGATTASPAGVEGMTVLVRDEKTYLVVASRLYAPGDKVGNLRVERITEKEVWFHDGSALIKVPRFARIERKSIIAKPLCAAAVDQPELEVTRKPPIAKIKVSKTRAKRSSPASAPTPQPAVAPCEDAQP